MPELPWPDPPLQTDRLGLRPWRTTDLEAVVDACQDADIARFAAAVPSPHGMADARAWFASLEPARLSGRRLELAITSRASGDVLGSIVLSNVEHVYRRAMVSFWVAPPARGKGVATDALQLFAAWALGPLGLMRLELFVEPDNRSSQRVAEQCGFTREGLLRSRWVNAGQRRDSIVYGLLADDPR
jgi:RimJ/RimL family protein N-acetyltransferase